MNRTAARDAIITAALRVLTAEREDNRHARAEGGLAEEDLALAARELTRAIDELPPDERPIGWDDAPAVEPQHAGQGQG